MTKKHYEKEVKRGLYKECNSSTKQKIDIFIENNQDFFYNYYFDTQKESYKYNDEYAIQSAADNFLMAV